MNIINLKAFFFASLLFLIGSLAFAYGLSFSVDTFNLYSLSSDGFDFAASLHYGDTIKSTMMSSIIVFMGVMFFVFSYALFDEAVKKYTSKFLIAVPLAITVFAVFVVKFETKNELFVNMSQDIYNSTAERYEDQSIFKNSIPAKEFKLALDNKNFEALKPYINDPKKIKGLNESEIFDKLLTVQNISNQSVREEFNAIYADGYITLEEYKTFKKNSMINIMNSLTAEIKTNISNDKVLATNL